MGIWFLKCLVLLKFLPPFGLICEVSVSESLFCCIESEIISSIMNYGSLDSEMENMIEYCNNVFYSFFFIMSKFKIMWITNY